MKPDIVKIDISGEASSYNISIGHGLLDDSGKWARKALGNKAAKILIISNAKIYGLYGQQVEASLVDAGFNVAHFLMKDGERHKSLKTTEAALKFIAENGISRTDAVVALGGGVVGDMAGFAAAIYLRGIAFLQIPTTLLSMVDSSVGGKTGVNSAFGKNLIGAFYQPKGVLIDTKTLLTLPERELTAGFCEVVKHGAIAGYELLSQTSGFLNAGLRPESGSLVPHISNFKREMAELILANVSFKAKIVAGDERESSGRRDHRSRKILNFGHTLGHALEKITNYTYFKHGEAVGYGILFAAELSKSLALCDEKSVNLLNDVLHRVGTLPALANIDRREVFEAFKFDKKNISGSLEFILLKGIGKPVIVKDSDIPPETIQQVLKKFLRDRA